MVRLQQDHNHRQPGVEAQSPSVASPSQGQGPRAAAHQHFADVAQQHLAAVVGQLLEAEGAEDAAVWQPIITRLALDAANAVTPSALAAFGVSDPRFYIRVWQLTSTLPGIRLWQGLCRPIHQG